MEQIAVLVLAGRLVDRTRKKPELASNGGVPMRDGTSSRWASARNSACQLWARDRLPAAYGLAITIGLSAALWAIIIGIAVLLP